MLVAFVAVSLISSCVGDKPIESDPCTTHIDVNKDGKCDKCSANVEIEECTDHIDVDGDNLCEICGKEVKAPVTISVNVKNESGAPMQGISVSLKNEYDEETVHETDSKGSLSITLLPGKYAVNFEGLEDGWYVDGSGSFIEISEDKTIFDFTAIDNNPDGTEKKPFFVGDDTVEKTFAPNVTYHYTAKGASKLLVVDNVNAKVIYDGKEYFPENGVIRIQIAATEDTTSTTPFAITNTSNSDNVIAVRFEALAGSQGNPHKAELDKALSATVKQEETVYFTYTAAENGYLVLVSKTKNNNIMMYNLTSFVVTGYTNGGSSVCIYASAGDVISIAVASNSASAENTVDFTVTQVDGTSEPIPVYDTISIRLDSDKVTFIYHGENKKLTIPTQGISKITVGAHEVTNQNGNFVFDVAEGTVFEITSSVSEKLEVNFKLS